MKNINVSVKQLLKYNFIGTQYEWEYTLDNIFRSFEKKLGMFTPANLLDVGCGRGDRTIRIANYFSVQINDIYGVDIDEKLIGEAKKMFNAEQIDLETDNIPWKKNTFDLVVCNQVLEHLKNYKKVVDDLIRVTKKEGYIVIGIPNLAHLINRVYLLLGFQPLCIHLDGPHVRAFTHKSFVRMLSSFDRVKLVDTRGSLMYPLPILITKYVSDYFVGLTGYTCYLLKKIF